MKRLIHLFMGLGRDEARGADPTPAFEERLRNAVERLNAELGSALSELSAQVSERNRVRVEASRLSAQSEALRNEARRLLEQDEAQARERLSLWAEVRQVWQGASEELERLDAQCVTMESKVADLRARLAESQRNTNTLLARRSASRAQQRLAEAVAAGQDEHAGLIDIVDAHNATSALPRLDLDREMQRLRDEMKG